MISTLERYISYEVLKPMAVVLLIFATLFACFSSARYLAEAVTETLGLYYLLELIFLKTFIALEVLTPVALYVAVIIGLGRLHRDQEIIAMRASGLSNRHIIRAVLLIAVPTAIAVGLLSVAGRPWAYERSYWLDAQANADLNTDRFQAGRFYGNEDAERVIYIGQKDPDTGVMRQIFHYVRRPDSSEITMASRATRSQVPPDAAPALNLFQGYVYRLHHSDAVDEVTQYDTLVRNPDPQAEAVGYKRKAASTLALSQSAEPTDIAELQWRLSRPLVTILLALIAIPLSRNSPRQGKNERAFIAAFVFAVYYNLSGVARTWVEQGLVAQFPGIWWLHALMLVLLVIIFAPDPHRRKVS